MAYTIRLADLASMTEREADSVCEELARSVGAPRNGELLVLNAQIGTLEMRYEMSSDEMRSRLENGLLSETADIARWLYLLDARDNRVRG